MNLSDSVSTLPGVGPAYAQKLEKLYISSIGDLLEHYPRLYLNYGNPLTIRDLPMGIPTVTKVRLVSLSNKLARSGKWFQQASFTDGKDFLSAMWFNQPYLAKSLHENGWYYLAGKLEPGQKSLFFMSPDIEPVTDSALHTLGFVPIYSETKGVSSKWLRSRIKVALNTIQIEDLLSDSILNFNELIGQDRALKQIHFPKDESQIKQAQLRLAFNDLLSIHLKSDLTKLAWKKQSALSIPLDTKLKNEFITSLPYSLTSDQIKAVDRILADINKPYPMNRLLQGDVGSGKTVVAAAAILATIIAGKQVILMAPTQILATQHWETLSKMLANWGIHPSLVTGQNKKRESSPLMIGTHALLFENDLIQNENLGLLIIDEQHRFGVAQRTHFLKNKITPHILTMTATPIPRTMALSLYGHLDISNLRTKPLGRLPIKTWVVGETKRKDAYQWIKDQIKTLHNQVFIVCPLIDQSESETLKDVKSVTKEYETLSKNIFPEFKVGLLHGRMKPNEKETILNDFRQQKYDILVSTPVIEVGIDIPQATIMMIETADRFGLAALHQLRGRVGRNDLQSYCLLFSSNPESESIDRLKNLENINDGLKLARLDLKLRGAGEIYGFSQSGHVDTRFGAFWNRELNMRARNTANMLTKNDSGHASNLLTQLNPKLASFSAGN